MILKLKFNGLRSKIIYLVVKEKSPNHQGINSSVSKFKQNMQVRMKVLKECSVIQSLLFGSSQKAQTSRNILSIASVCKTFLKTFNRFIFA